MRHSSAGEFLGIGIFFVCFTLMIVVIIAIGNAVFGRKTRVTRPGYSVEIRFSSHGYGCEVVYLESGKAVSFPASLPDGWGEKREITVSVGVFNAKELELIAPRLEAALHELKLRPQLVAREGSATS